MGEIERLRGGIDKVDRELVSLLEKRARLAERIGAAKAKTKRPVLAPDREQQVFDKIERLRPKALESAELKSVFREIIQLCRAKQKIATVAYLGPEATFSHQAARRSFGPSARYVPCRQIAEVFEAVDKEHADYGVVPIENSLEGTVHETLDCLSAAELPVAAEIVSEIYHYLLSTSGRLKDVEHLYSHPQALGQCRTWISRHLPKVSAHPTASTADAAMQAALDAKAAAIASAAAKDIYHLKVAAARIEDHSNNLTRFFVIARQPAPRTGKDKTSLIFAVEHRPGGLFDALSPFRDEGVNLTKIESRPSRKKPWEYHFFLEFSGHLSDPAAEKAVAGLKRQATFLKIFGSYPIP